MTYISRDLYRYTWCCQEVGDSSIHLSSSDDKEYDTEKVLFIHTYTFRKIRMFPNTHQDPTPSENLSIVDCVGRRCRGCLAISTVRFGSSDEFLVHLL